MFFQLKKNVSDANKLLETNQLVTLTWGNVSEIDKDLNVIGIKPSGIPYSQLKPEHIVIVNLDGQIIDGDLNPSSDLETHLYLYNKFPTIKGITHTHSSYATSFAQSGISIPPLGTTHADHFYGSIPITRKLSDNEILYNYERNTGRVIYEIFSDLNIMPQDIPGVLVNQHGPFTWGKSALDSLENAIALEEVAKMTFNAKLLSNNFEAINQTLLDKHFLRKNGARATYGQNNNSNI
ncbi:L-ribulose-5-phosphate 4-epimerase [Salinicoccus jeotgali]|nr:L-ribulose-5-phosphate 4-epimerase AraD [Jeotgalicoccus schoeneichii]GGH51909.1 L-ribulose-5-phosphate 4-epimerase [Jeotgalicoccus schoeneichii]